MNKAEVVFNKLSQFEGATVDGSYRANRMITQHLVKSYAKHGDKGMLRQFKNEAIMDPLRKITSLTSPEGHAKVVKNFKQLGADILKNIKRFR